MFSLYTDIVILVCNVYPFCPISNVDTEVDKY